jgi:hypothetical protein
MQTSIIGGISHPGALMLRDMKEVGAEKDLLPGCLRQRWKFSNSVCSEIPELHGSF